MGQAYWDANKSPLAYIRMVMYYEKFGFDIICGDSRMQATHRATGAVVHKSKAGDDWNVPHLLANSLNASHRPPKGWLEDRAERQKSYRKQKRK